MQEEQIKRKELRKTLKKKVLNRVLSPDFNDNVHAIVAQNAMMSRMRDMRDIPEDHKQEVDEIRQSHMLVEMLRGRLVQMGLPADLIQDEPRAVKQLNLLERHKRGEAYKWTAGPVFDPAVMAYLNIHPGSMALN